MGDDSVQVFFGHESVELTGLVTVRDGYKTFTNSMRSAKDARTVFEEIKEYFEKWDSEREGQPVEPVETDDWQPDPSTPYGAALLRALAAQEGNK